MPGQGVSHALNHSGTVCRRLNPGPAAGRRSDINGRGIISVSFLFDAGRNGNPVTDIDVVPNEKHSGIF